jgi:hypothetical protein
MHSFNPHATAEQVPIDAGMQVVMPDPGLAASDLPSALYEDARTRHYQELFSKWEQFRSNWKAHLDKHASWIVNVGSDLLNFSNMPPHPASAFNAPYIMHLNLGLFITNRLMGIGKENLVRGTQHDDDTVSDGLAMVGKGSPQQVTNLFELINSRLDFNRSKAQELLKELESLQTEKADLIRQFSLAIAAKGLKGRCDLVKLL